MNFKNISKHLFTIIYPLVIVGCCIAYECIFGFGKHDDYAYEIYRENAELEFFEAKYDVVKAVNKYINTVAPESAVNGCKIFDLCEEYNVDLKFVLAQGQLESHFGTTGMAMRTNSIFNIMAYDTTNASEMIRNGHCFKHPDMSIEPYLKIITTRYLTDGKSESDMFINYIDKNGHRYASSQTYENDLYNIYSKIDSITDITAPYLKYKKYKTILGK